MIRDTRGSFVRLAVVGGLAMGLVAAAVARRLGPPDGPDVDRPPAGGRASAVAPPAEPAARADWPPGPLREAATIPYVLLSGDRGLAATARTLLPALARRHLPGFAVVEIEEGAPAPPGPVLGWTAVPAEPFDRAQLAYAARGLDEAGRARVERGLPAVFLVVRAPPDAAHRALRGTVALVAEAARRLHAFVHDPETRLVFGLAAFRQDVLEGGFEGDVPVVPAHVEIHAYRTGGAQGLLRSVTLGMSKLGLPDVVVNGHRAGTGARLASVVNAVCQRLDDDPVVARAGHLALDVRALRSARVRAPILRDLEAGARASADLTIASGRREEGDAENRLLELTFGGPDGAATERQETVLALVLGADDRVTRVRSGDPELAAARDRARAELLALREPYRKGLPLGSRLDVKAPFREGDGVEYMWIEVSAWEDGILRGFLLNQPEVVTGLRPGALVQVREDDAYDFLLSRPDGTQTGNYTGEVLKRREAEAKGR